MRAELYRPDAPDRVVAVATWDGRTAHLQVENGGLEGLDEILRPTPVCVDDPSLRRPGARGPSVLQPGDLEWFLATVRERAAARGLAARVVTSLTEGGWDPAAQYRRFDDSIERLVARDRG